MFKRITALFLVLSFTQVHAVTPVHQSLSLASEMSKAFDDLNYRLNVEWDQKDSKYVKEVYEEFKKEIAVLQEQGLSNQELTKYTLEKIKDQKTKDEINAITKSIGENQMSPEEARDFAISKLNQMYSHGASWSGSRMTIHNVALVLAVIAIIYCCTQVKDGKDGRDGKDGEQGPQGPAGTNGTNTVTGGCPDGYEFQINGNNGTAICHVIDD